MNKPLNKVGAAMNKLPPIYKEPQKRYQADTCQALVAAVASGKARLEALARGSYPGRPLPAAALPGLSSVGFWDVIGQQDWGLAPHRNEGIEFTFLERGSLPFTVAGQDHTLHPGDLTITRPWQAHRVGNPTLGASRLHWMILDVSVRRPNETWQWPGWVVMQPGDLAEFTRMLRCNERPVWRTTDELRACFLKIAHAVEADRSGSAVSRLAVHLNELLVLILEMLRGYPVSLNESLTSTERTVELFLADLRPSLPNLAHPWTLESMAAQCGLGATRFVHHCKQITNMAPMQYLNRCRIEAAARLMLQEPGLSIAAVAEACGFSSSQYFATVFSRHHKCSPSDYRQRNFETAV